MARKLKVFCVYAIEDLKLKERLEKHLSILARNPNYEINFNGEIAGNNEWSEKLLQTLSSTDVVLVLLSADILYSQYFYDTIMLKILAQYDNGSSKFVPIILSRCDWRKTRFGKFGVSPSIARPIDTWDNESEALFDVKRELEKIFENRFKKILN